MGIIRELDKKFPMYFYSIYYKYMVGASDK